jgi:hypothetical protein
MPRSTMSLAFNDALPLVANEAVNLPVPLVRMAYRAMRAFLSLLAKLIVPVFEVEDSPAADRRVVGEGAVCDRQRRMVRDAAALAGGGIIGEGAVRKIGNPFSKLTTSHTTRNPAPREPRGFGCFALGNPRRSACLYRQSNRGTQHDRQGVQSSTQSIRTYQ